MLTGENLEMIEKIGWTESQPVEVTGSPAPLPGPGLKQVLELGLSDPPKPGAALWIWLRGDQEPRAANVPVSDLPADAAPQFEPARRTLAGRTAGATRSSKISAGNQSVSRRKSGGDPDVEPTERRIARSNPFPAPLPAMRRFATRAIPLHDQMGRIPRRRRLASEGSSSH